MKNKKDSIYLKTFTNTDLIWFINLNVKSKTCSFPKKIWDSRVSVFVILMQPNSFPVGP